MPHEPFAQVEPFKPLGALQSNVNYMDTAEEDMQNVPQPTITPRTNVANLRAQINSLSAEDNDTLIEMMGSSQDFTPA